MGATTEAFTTEGEPALEIAVYALPRLPAQYAEILKCMKLLLRHGASHNAGYSFLDHLEDSYTHNEHLPGRDSILRFAREYDAAGSWGAYVSRPRQAFATLFAL